MSLRFIHSLPENVTREVSSKEKGAEAPFSFTNHQLSSVNLPKTEIIGTELSGSTTRVKINKIFTQKIPHLRNLIRWVFKI
jgi:hypothetical protein